MHTAQEIAYAIKQTTKNWGRIYLCGNGGSAADANHFAAELIGKYRSFARRPYPAISLCANAEVLTAISNDFGYRAVFGRQLLALGKPGDLLITFTTSGRSGNICAVGGMATTLGIQRIEFGPIEGLNTAQTQEVHQKLYHEVCELLE